MSRPLEPPIALLNARAATGINDLNESTITKYQCHFAGGIAALQSIPFAYFTHYHRQCLPRNPTGWEILAYHVEVALLSSNLGYGMARAIIFDLQKIFLQIFNTLIRCITVPFQCTVLYYNQPILCLHGPPKSYSTVSVMAVWIMWWMHCLPSGIDAEAQP